MGIWVHIAQQGGVKVKSREVRHLITKHDENLKMIKKLPDKFHFTFSIVTRFLCFLKDKLRILRQLFSAYSILRILPDKFFPQHDGRKQDGI